VSGCPGLHCDGCGQAGGGGLLLAAAAALAAHQLGAPVGEVIEIAAASIGTAVMVCAAIVIRAALRFWLHDMNPATACPGSKAHAQLRAAHRPPAVPGPSRGAISPHRVIPGAVIHPSPQRQEIQR